MSAHDVEDGADTFARIGRACDALSDVGFPEVAGIVARGTRERRGVLRRKVYPARLARELVDLADALERLLRFLPAVSCSATYARTRSLIERDDAVQLAALEAPQRGGADYIATVVSGLLESDDAELCPMGCGRTTTDPAGGPCAGCWDELPGERDVFR
jgi:hypothetical protein